MKLYTEEDIYQAIADARYYQEQIMPSKSIVQKLTPIELLSDEDAEKAIIDQDIVRQQGYCHCFLEGAKWMKEQILNQNK